jgi:hypothetical protein
VCVRVKICLKRMKGVLTGGDGKGMGLCGSPATNGAAQAELAEPPQSVAEQWTVAVATMAELRQARALRRAGFLMWGRVECCRGAHGGMPPQSPPALGPSSGGRRAWRPPRSHAPAPHEHAQASEQCALAKAIMPPPP